MSFAKLFSTITASSLWGESKEVKILFVTMLAQADSSGFVEASIPGLARLANLTPAETEEAITNLESPDPHSKSKVADGRRIVKVNNGWALVNYEDYRNRRDDQKKRDYMRDYMRDYRKRNVSSVNNVNQVNTNDGDVTVNSVSKNVLQLAQAEAEAYADGEGNAFDNAYAHKDRRMQGGKDLEPQNSPAESGARAREGNGQDDPDEKPEPPAKRPDEGRETEPIPYGFANRVWEFWGICQVSDRPDQHGFFAKLAWADCLGFDWPRPILDFVGRAKRAASPAAFLTDVIRREIGPQRWAEFSQKLPTHTHCLWALEEIDAGRRNEGTDGQG